ncbi:restriction endonuclease subunit S [Salmonella enterica]|nr:restriction endonuclease subunit S [Salmonella enterica]
MSELNYLEKLLDGTEVEWKALGDVTSVLRGKRLTKNLLSAEEKFPVFHGGLEPLGYYNKSNRPANTVMIINVGASAGTVGYSTVDFWSSDGCFCLEHNELLNNRFLYFALIGYQSLLKSKVRVAGIPTLDAIVVNKLLIPIPCPENPEKSLAIQSAIVRILDKFTALTAELTAELTARKKQYNYYRDQLLSFEDGEVEWKSLGEVAIITIGEFVRKDKQNPDADYPVYNGGRTPTGYYEDFNNDGDKIIVSARGANAGFVNKSSTPYWAGNSCYSISVRSTEQLHWMYVYYYLKQSETKLTGIQQKGGIPAVSKKQMEDLLLPIPSKSEQVRIVTILDKFDTLTSSITEGLPREIELRQKQYEYYRDLLFSFPRPETASN